MPDVQHRAVGPCDPEQLARLLDGRRHGLFDQHVHTGLEQVARDREVRVCRYRHADHVDPAGQLAVIGEGERVVLAGDLPGALEVDVHDPHEVHVPELGVDERVVLPHVTSPHDRCAHPPIRLAHQNTRSP